MKLFKSKKDQSNFNRHIFVLYIAAVVLLIGLSGVVALLIRPLQQDNSANTFVVRSYIKEAIEGLSNQTIVDPKERKEYIYEASLRFPAVAGERFRYGYFKDSDDKETIQLSANEIFRDAAATLNKPDIDDVFNNVPQFQACSREFILQFVEGLEGYENDYTLAKTLPLADGRTVYLYRSDACASIYDSGDINVNDHQAILEKLESY